MTTQVSKCCFSWQEKRTRIVRRQRILRVAALVTVPVVVVLVLSLALCDCPEDEQQLRMDSTIDGNHIVVQGQAEALERRRPHSFRRSVHRRRTKSRFDDHDDRSAFAQTPWMANLFRVEDNLQRNEERHIQPLIVRGQDVKKETQTRIVGGRDVDAVSSFPSFVFTAGTQLCGGTLIHEDIVLTAAHCINAFVNGTIVGSLQLDGTGGSLAAVEREFPHPGYNPKTDENDIMLVLLSEPVMDIPLQALNIDESIPADGEIVTVIGFGFTSEAGSLSDTLQEVQVNVVDFETCNDYFGRIVNDIMLCAGAADSGRDSCQGDSGGPLLTEEGLQVGLVSFGSGCGRPDVPAAVYARISGFDRFIEGGICDLSANPPASCADLSTNSTTTTSPALSTSTAAPNVSTAPSITGMTPTGSPSPTDSRTSAPAFTSIPTTTDVTVPPLSPAPVQVDPNDGTGQPDPTVAPNISTPGSSPAPSSAGTFLSTIPPSPSPTSDNRTAVPLRSVVPTEGPVAASTGTTTPFSTAVPTSRVLNEKTVAPTSMPTEQSRLPISARVNSAAPSLLFLPPIGYGTPTVASQPASQTTQPIPSGNSSSTPGPTIFLFGGGTSPPTDGPTPQPTIAPTIFRFGAGTSPTTDVLLPPTFPSLPPTRNPYFSPHIDIPTLFHTTYSPASASNPTRPVFDRLTLSPNPQLDIPTLIFGTRKPSRPVFDVPVPSPVSIASLIMGHTPTTETATPHIDISALILAPYPAASTQGPARKTIVPPSFLWDKSSPTSKSTPGSMGPRPVPTPAQSPKNYFYSLPGKQITSSKSSSSSSSLSYLRKPTGKSKARNTTKHSKGKETTSILSSESGVESVRNGSRGNEVEHRKRMRKRYQSRAGRIIANLEV